MPRIRKSFRGTIKEMRFYANTIFILESLLSATLVFLITFLVLAFFRLFALMAVMPAAVYFVYKLQNKLRINKLKMVETYYPELEEKLRTAYDYRISENPLAVELKRDVTDKFKIVEASTFLDTKRLSVNTVLCLALCFLVLFLVPHSIRLDEYNYFFEFAQINKIPLYKDITGFGKGEPVPGDSGSFSDGSEDYASDTGVVTRDIFGDYVLSEAGEKTIEVKLKQAGYEFTLREAEESSEAPRRSVFSEEVFGVGSETHEENIPKEKQQLVKNYFNEIGG